ncbi:hypothetical protein BS47DRAFT_1381009 [Hydnum rufescens UP504]|uniref:Uncharacterized protein n=1 Tax=Hydnum rufescens UP504 TaxID=1448309 RepID=A0A9P6B2Q5_9AGAM|nr:hypothetical protein BS47DRAFT_1381009 [Hydnum rufescens UP504]
MNNTNNPDDWNAFLKNSFALRAGILMIAKVALVPSALLLFTLLAADIPGARLSNIIGSTMVGAKHGPLQTHNCSAGFIHVLSFQVHQQNIPRSHKIPQSSSHPRLVMSNDEGKARGREKHPPHKAGLGIQKSRSRPLYYAFGDFLWPHEATSRRIGITRTVECASSLAMVRPSTSSSSKPFVSTAIEHEVSQFPILLIYAEQPQWIGGSGRRMKGENNRKCPNQEQVRIDNSLQKKDEEKE